MNTMKSFLASHFFLHLVQHLSSKYWSNSSQSNGRQTTSRHKIGSALLFIGIPPLRSFAHDRSSGTVTASAQHIPQHVPVTSGPLYSKGGVHSTVGQLISLHNGVCGSSFCRTRRLLINADEANPANVRRAKGAARNIQYLILACVT